MLNSIENLIGKKQTLVNPLIPMSDQTAFLLTISTQYQPDKGENGEKYQFGDN